MLAVFVVIMKGYTDYGAVDSHGAKMDENEGVDYSILAATGVVSVLWFVWSIFLVKSTSEYAYTLGEADTTEAKEQDCESPDHTILYYMICVSANAAGVLCLILSDAVRTLPHTQPLPPSCHSLPSFNDS